MKTKNNIRGYVTLQLAIGGLFACLFEGVVLFFCSFRTLQASLIQQKALYIKAKENTSYQIKKVEMSKRSLRDKEKYCDKEKQNIKELEMELHDTEKAWREFEKEAEEEILLRVERVELRERQVKWVIRKQNTVYY